MGWLSWVGLTGETDKGSVLDIGYSPPVASDRVLPLETLDECCVRSGFRIRRWLPTGNPNHLFIGTLRRDALVQPDGGNG